MKNTPRSVSLFLLVVIIQINIAQNIQSYKSKEIIPYKAKEIKLDKGKSIQSNQEDKNQQSKNRIEKPTNSTVNNTAGESKENPSSDSEVNKNKEGTNGVEKLFGTWQTKVPGAVWESPSGIQGYNNLHVSAGVISGALEIFKNGTYKWNSYGGKKGKWVMGDSEYPIVLIDNVEKKKWKVGLDSKHSGGRDIIIWDGYTWYDGKK